MARLQSILRLAESYRSEPSKAFLAPVDGVEPREGLRKNVEPSTHATAGQNQKLQIQDARQRGPRESYEPFIANRTFSLSLRVDHQGVAPRVAPRGILKNGIPHVRSHEAIPERTKWRNSVRAEMGFTSDTRGRITSSVKRHNLSKYPLRGRGSERSIPGSSNEASTPGRIGSIEDLVSVSGPERGTSRCHRPRFNSTD